MIKEDDQGHGESGVHVRLYEETEDICAKSFFHLHLCNFYLIVVVKRAATLGV